ncbi:hypothetical protein BH11ACT8_BH11ACT8_10630 [soil metagenome]
MRRGINPDYRRRMLGTHPRFGPLMSTLSTPAQGFLTRVREWPVAAQQHARRNAMIATTAAAQRRIERDEVADYLRGLDHHRAVAAPDPESEQELATARRSARG